MILALRLAGALVLLVVGFATGVAAVAVHELWWGLPVISLLAVTAMVALGRSIEYFRIPRNVMTICVGKSTYARCGIITNVTPFEPEWEGFVTLEISNTTPLPARIYANEGIAQVLFFESDEACAVSYADRQGKYQAQQGIVLPKV